ncbi:FtsX-like permease family protein [Streptomyces sp. NPDC048506]|uniref:ABC transporter permease n=1 Tax=Streptomyces sp. NPDC048506 TaxID=3155028 RepID=UPI00342832C2
MFRTALRNVLAHKARLLMTVLAVLLGVAFVSGTLVFTDTLGNAYKNQSAKSYDNVAAAITSSGSPSGPPRGKKHDEGISQQTVDRIGKLPGVASATGQVSGFAGVADTKGKLIGTTSVNSGTNFAPGTNGRDPRYAFVSGRGPARTGEVALDKDTADTGGLHVGDPARIATNGPVKTYTVTGVFTTDDSAVSAGGSLALFDTASAQSLYLAPGHFSDVTVTADKGVSQQKILDEVTPLLPKDGSTTAQTGKQLADQQAQHIEQQFSLMGIVLLVFAAIAVFVGIFLIANTFTMLVAQRAKELALLRALGASRHQVSRSVLTEALIVGATASAAGFGGGVGIAVALRSAIGSLGFKVPSGPLVVAPTTVVATFAVGVLITMSAAWLPARRAAKIPPVAAMNSSSLPAPTKSLAIRNAVGAFLAVAGAALIAAGSASTLRNGTAYLIGAGSFLLLVGVITLAPLLSQPAIAAARPPSTRMFGVCGNLAAANARRNPRRTGATASALTIGLTLVTGLTVLGVSVGRVVDHRTVDNLSADYMVQALNGTSIEESAASQISKVPGVTAATALRQAQVDVGGDRRSVTAADPDGLAKTVKIKTVHGSQNALGDGKLLVDDQVARKHGWKVGAPLHVNYPDGTKARMTVGGTFADNLVLSSVVMPDQMVTPHLGRPEIHRLLVTVSGGADAKTAQAITDGLGDNPAISVMDQQGIRDAFGGRTDTTLNIMYGLLGMSLIIAVLGVINTLAMSVFERRSEIGMLRAVGLDRGAVKRMIRLESVVISLFGAVTGVVLGLFIAWAAGHAITPDVQGYVMVIPWPRIALFLPLAALVGVLAASWPARRAANLDLLGSIKTE